MTEPQESISVSIAINGDENQEMIPSNTLLSEYIRDYQYLTGTHRGCETAKCGACTVLLDGDAVKSCNILAVQADGKEVTTVEGLGERDELHPIQQSFLDNHGFQCGYCTPGFIMATDDLLAENSDPNYTEIQDWLAGNICRCTGYTKIIESVMEAATKEANQDTN